MRLDSSQYNGLLKIKSQYGIDFGKNFEQIDDFSGIPLRIKAVSTDGEDWSTLNKDEYMQLKGGDSLYLRLKAVKDGNDLTKGNVFST